jgi:hypothetical protein
VRFSTACCSAFITSVVSKWRPFSFICIRGNRKVRLVEDDSRAVFCKKFPGEKRNATRCFVMMQRSVLL